MSEEKKYNYTAADIEKYHKGLLSPKEMYQLEKAALDDPFLADALEGYAAVPGSSGADLSEIEKKLEERVGAKVISMTPAKTSFKWWRVAAAIIILGGTGFFVYRVTSTSPEKPLATNEEKKTDQQTQPEQRRTDTISQEDSINTRTATTPIISINGNHRKVKTKTTVKTDTVSSSGAIAKTNGINADSSYPSGESNTRLTTTFSVSEYKKESTSTPKTSDDHKDLALDKSKTTNTHDSLSLNRLMALEKRSLGKDNVAATNYFRGRILDENKNPLAFANITNTRDNVGTYADAKGNFTLISPDSILRVQIRSVGYENQNALLRNNVASNLVVLNEDRSLPATVLNNKPAVNTNRYREGNITVEEPEDGWGNYDTYLANNIKIPQDTRAKQPAAEVEVSFEVNENGDPVNIKVEKSLCKKCDQEAVRLVKEGPKWKKKNKAAGRVKITVPFYQ